MTIENKKKSLAWLNNIIGNTSQKRIFQFGFLGIIYALLYIGDVLKDGLKKLEKKK